MDKRMKISEEVLEDITGGQITYTWDGTTGTIGSNGNNPFILVDKAAFVSYYNSVKGQGLSDAEILTNLIKQGVVKKP